jgi:NAD-dependent dihydropyrimidine dehydrogenase PreA subunit/flavodoxin
LLIRKKLK